MIAAQDKAFDHAMLVHMTQRIDAEITTVPGSHAVFMTQAKRSAALGPPCLRQHTQRLFPGPRRKPAMRLECAR